MLSFKLSTKRFSCDDLFPTVYRKQGDDRKWMTGCDRWSNLFSFRSAILDRWLVQGSLAAKRWLARRYLFNLYVPVNLFKTFSFYEMFVVINMVAVNGLKGTKNSNTLCCFPLIQNRKPTMVKSTHFLECKWNFGYRMFFHFQFQTIGNNTISRFYP